VNTSDNADPADIRIRNVSTTGFEIAQIEPDGSDGALTATTVDYFVLEEGVHTLPSGAKIEAGYIDTTSTVSHSSVSTNSVWETITYVESFNDPVVQAQIQSANNELGALVSSPFITASIDNVTASSFSLSMDRAEVNSGVIDLEERLAYFIIDNNVTEIFEDVSGTTIHFEALNSATNIKGVGDNSCQISVFQLGYQDTPLIIATKTNRNGNNGGWIRQCSVSTTSAGMVVDEDQYKDNERNHINEDASIFVISEPFSAVMSQ
jgi:hypothetical protein